jgi:Lon protease-like protein
VPGRGAALPIFPLSNVVLFPGIRTPLHVFEPRYRQMTEHALEGDRRIGMVAVRPEHAADLSGDPPVYPIGCAGLVRESQRLPDGRYNIVLLGSHRFRICSERPRASGRLYRVAEIEPLDDPLAPEEHPRVAALRARVSELLAELLEPADAGARGERLPTDRLARLDDVSFTNALCHALTLAPREKQALLEAEGIALRLERLVGLLGFRVGERAAARVPGSEALH